MSARRVEITLSQSVWDRLESRRGDVPRAAFIKRALERALGSEMAAVSAPSRAPVVAEDLDAFAAGEVDHSADAGRQLLPGDAVDRAANSGGFTSHWDPNGTLPRPARDVMWERQQRLNKGSASRKGKKP